MKKVDCQGVQGYTNPDDERRAHLDTTLYEPAHGSGEASPNDNGHNAPAEDEKDDDADDRSFLTPVTQGLPEVDVVRIRRVGECHRLQQPSSRGFQWLRLVAAAVTIPLDGVVHLLPRERRHRKVWRSRSRRRVQTMDRAGDTAFPCRGSRFDQDPLGLEQANDSLVLIGKCCGVSFAWRCHHVALRRGSCRWESARFGEGGTDCTRIGRRRRNRQMEQAEDKRRDAARYGRRKRSPALDDAKRRGAKHLSNGLRSCENMG
mmetsp:Transcript_61031/g.170747  ORF Transcript_61031/g.170747 Transcript_61031/m.170747 type:complete len:261 (+) Transcript_61031:660-1442(+)